MGKLSPQFAARSATGTPLVDKCAFCNRRPLKCEKLSSAISINLGARMPADIVIIFMVVGFVIRCALYYITDGLLILSAPSAFIWTAISCGIFFALSKLIKRDKAALLGSVVYYIVFLFAYTYLFANPSLTVKSNTNYIFISGVITWYGVLYYSVVALLDTAVSAIALLITRAVQFYLNERKGRGP